MTVTVTVVTIAKIRIFDVTAKYPKPTLYHFNIAVQCLFYISSCSTRLFFVTLQSENE